MAVPDPQDPDLAYSNAALDLGQGRKVRPFAKPRASETLTILDVDGPGVIQHIWMATETNWKGNGRTCIPRFYWDGEETPSVEVPLTDFFAIGHDLFAPVNSLAVIVNPASWPTRSRTRGPTARRNGACTAGTCRTPSALRATCGCRSRPSAGGPMQDTNPSPKTLHPRPIGIRESRMLPSRPFPLCRIAGRDERARSQPAVRTGRPQPSSAMVAVSSDSAKIRSMAD